MKLFIKSLALAVIAAGLPDASVSINSIATSPPASTRGEVETQAAYETSSQHYLSLRAKARPAQQPLPDWSGLWLNAEPLQFDPGHPILIITTAPLKPEPAAHYAKLVSDAKRGIQWDLLSQCLSAGYPRMLAEQHPFEFIVTPKETWIQGELMNEAHRIYTDGRGHYPDDEAYPLWEGDSIGFWDGDTLVVHTTNLKAVANGYQRSGPPQSDKTTTVEQWRMIDSDHLVLLTPSTIRRIFINHGGRPRAHITGCARPRV